MFKNTFQSGFLSILYSIGSKREWSPQAGPDGDNKLTLCADTSSFADLGLQGKEWTHQKNHRSGYSKLGAGDYGHERLNQLHCLPCWSQADPWNKASFPCDDHQESEEVFYLRSAGSRWQGGQEALPGIKLPVYNSCEAIHLHHADATWWGVEPNSVQPLRFHTPGIWYKLCGNSSCADTCKLSHPESLLLGPLVFRGRIASVSLLDFVSLSLGHCSNSCVLTRIIENM